jgi:PKD repeat protein
VTTYYVNAGPSGNNSNDGRSSGSPWKTLSKAASSISNGDTVKIAPGTYSERLTIRTPNSTWEHDGTAGTVYIEGGYTNTTAWRNNNQTYRPDQGSWGTGTWNAGGYQNLVNIEASGVTLNGKTKYGIVIRYAPGEGLQTTLDGHDAIIKFVHVDYCYGGGWRIFSNDTLVEDCACTRCGLQLFDPDSLAVGPAGVPVAFLVAQTDINHRTERVTVRRVISQCNWGEGIAAGFGSIDVVVESCESSTNYHLAFYANCGRDATFRNNIAWWDAAASDFTGSSGDTADGFVFGDESKRLASSDLPSLSARYYNNIAIGVRRGFQIRNNGSNYRTQVDGLYFGFNTIIATADAKFAIDLGGAPPNANPKALIENNVIEVLGGAVTAKGTDKYTFRNNVWRSTPPSSARGAGDVYANPRLTNPNFTLPATNCNKKGASFTPVSIRNSIQFAQLQSTSPAINKAASGSAGGVTPPSVTTDISGAARGAARDCGAWEFGGTPTDPGDELTANFSQSATSGEVPLTVNFVDTSVSTGTKTAWLWDFGNGATSTVQNPTYVYSTPGVYTPSLTVYDNNGLQATKTGSPITVIPATEPPSGGGSGGVAAARATTRTSTGSQTITGLGTKTPLALLFILSGAPTVGTQADNAHLCIGVWTPAAQYAQVIGGRDNVAAIDDRSGHVVGRVLARHSTADGYTGLAQVTSVGPGSVTLEYTHVFPAAYQLTVVSFGGASAQAKVSAAVARAKGSAYALADGDLSLIWSAFGDVTGLAQMSLGAAEAGAQVYHAWRGRSVQGATDINSWTGGGVSLNYLSPDSKRAYIDVANVASGAASVSTNDINKPVVSLGVRGMGAVKVGQFLAPSAAGSSSYTVGFAPTLVILWGGLIPSITGAQANNNPNNNAFWIAVVTAAGTYYTGIASTDGVTTSDTKSHAENSIKVYDGGGTVRLAGAVTLDADGFDVNWTTPRTVGVNYLAIEGTVAPDNALVNWSAAPKEIDEGEAVTFTNLTNTNGAAVSGYEWDFGDGSTSTEEDPVHVYTDWGTYTVTLTVTTNIGPVSLARQDYITVNYVPVYMDILTPSDPLPVTNTSKTALNLELTDDDDYNQMYLNTHGHELILDGAEIEIDPGPRNPAQGRILIYFDSNVGTNGSLMARLADGSTFVIAGLTPA